MKNNFVVVLCASFLAIVTVSVPCQAETIYACIHKEQGLTRIVPSLSECKSTERPISWNTIGPQGPVGPAGPAAGRSFTSSVISSTEVQACGAGELEGCETKALIGIRMSEEPVIIEALDVKSLVKDGESQGLLEIIHLEITKEFEVPCDDTDVTVTYSTHRNCGGENDYYIQTKLTKGSGNPVYFRVSPRTPTYGSVVDQHCAEVPADCPIPIQAKLNTDSLFRLKIDMAKLSVVSTESTGVMIEGTAIEYDAKKGVDMLKVVIWNAGNFKAPFIVSADNCTGIVSLQAQVETLQVQERRTTLWTLRAANTANQEGGHIKNAISCTVKLLSPNGRVYDELVVTRSYPY